MRRKTALHNETLLGENHDRDPPRRLAPVRIRFAPNRAFFLVIGHRADAVANFPTGNRRPSVPVRQRDGPNLTILSWRHGRQIRPGRPRAAIGVACRFLACALLDRGRGDGLHPAGFSTGNSTFMATSKAKTRRKSNALVENIKTIIYAGLIALVVRTFAFEPFNIPSGSMEPTLLVGDYLFVAKFSYGFSRYSFPFGWPPFSGRVFGRLPHRGDVAVFKYPRDNSTDYIKRIVGLPGDTIQVREGLLYINGVLAPRQPAGDFLADDNGIRTVYRRYVETLPDGVKHDELKATDEGDANNTQVYVVPPDHVFAMGDNRDNSADSRFLNGVGFVPVENLIGRAEIIFFSMGGDYPWWQFWQWPFEIRWDRLLMPVR